MNGSAAAATGGKKRIEWLDAMRGITMILVVAYHVAQHGFVEQEKSSAALPFLVLVRMPLFFFVSGFLAYKARFQWTLEATGRLLGRKAWVQVVPALIFILIMATFKMRGGFADNMAQLMASSTKRGYWFTWVLLQMFAVYYACSLLVHHALRLVPRLRRWEPVAWAGLWLLAVAAYETLYLPKVFTYHKAPFFHYTSAVLTIRYMHFFLLGNLTHRYWQQAQRLMDSAWFFPLAVVTAAVCSADIFRLHFLRFAWTNLPRTLAMYALLWTVVMACRHYGNFLSTSRTGRTLQYVGSHTLDIYLLHFLLLPSLPFVGAWLNANHPNFFLDILLSVGLALPVVATCLLVSAILHTSPALGKLLFGK